MQPSDVTDGMITRAGVALMEASVGDIDATDGELRDALAAALTAMPDDLLRKLVAERGCVMVPKASGDCRKPFFAFDSDYGTEFFASEAEALEWAISAIDHQREQAKFDGEWSEDVEGLRVGIITHTVVAVPLEDDCYDYRLEPRHIAASDPRQQAQDDGADHD